MTLVFMSTLLRSLENGMLADMRCCRLLCQRNELKLDAVVIHTLSCPPDYPGDG
jgi:hypothetical protein